MQRKKFWIAAAVGVAIWGSLILLGVYRCPIYATLGIPCAGCGMTRAVRCLLQLDFAGAWQNHPGVYALLAFGVVGLVSAAVCSKTGGRPVYKRSWYWLAIGAVMIGIYIARMVLIFPTRMPMVYDVNGLAYKLYCLLTGKGV